MPIWTPWGNATSKGTRVAQGITIYDTPGHGGVKLSQSRLQKMPQCIRYFQSANGYGWFEEDVDVILPILAFPKDWLRWAPNLKGTLDAWDEYKDYFESGGVNAEAWDAAYREQFIVIANSQPKNELFTT